MRVAALYRVSTEKQENEGASLDAQQRIFHERAERDGWVIVAEFRGQESATKAASERTVLQQAVSCLRSESVDALWVVEQSRATRGDELEVAILHRELREHDVQLVVGWNAPTDVSSIEGSLVFGIQSVVDRTEARRIKERFQRGRRQRALEGKKTGGAAPFGYRNPPKGDPLRGQLQVVEDEAAVVRRIFRDVAGGSSLRTIASQLTAEGIPAPRGGAWGKTTLRRMLANPAYVGMSVASAWTAEPGSNTFRFDPTRPDAVVVEDAHEPILSPTLWQSARAQLVGTSNGRPAMLTGLLWIDGRRAHVDASDGSSFYKPADGAPGPWVPAHDLQGLVWRAFAHLLREPGTIRRLLGSARKGGAERATAAELEAVRRRRARLEARLERLVEMRADGEISKAEFGERAEGTRRAIRETEDAERAARRRARAATAGEIKRSIDGLRHLLGRGARLSGDQKRRALRELLEGVHVELEERSEPQARAEGGRFAAAPGPKWSARDVVFRLRPWPGLATTDFDCGRLLPRLTVQVVRDGRLLERSELEARPAVAGAAS